MEGEGGASAKGLRSIQAPLSQVAKTLHGATFRGPEYRGCAPVYSSVLVSRCQMIDRVEAKKTILPAGVGKHFQI